MRASLWKTQLEAASKTVLSEEVSSDLAEVVVYARVQATYMDDVEMLERIGRVEEAMLDG